VCVVGYLALGFWGGAVLLVFILQSVASSLNSDLSTVYFWFTYDLVFFCFTKVYTILSEQVKQLWFS